MLEIDPSSWGKVSGKIGTCKLSENQKRLVAHTTLRHWRVKSVRSLTRSRSWTRLENRRAYSIRTALKYLQVVFFFLDCRIEHSEKCVWTLFSLIYVCFAYQSPRSDRNKRNSRLTMSGRMIGIQSLAIFAYPLSLKWRPSCQYKFLRFISKLLARSISSPARTPSSFLECGRASKMSVIAQFAWNGQRRQHNRAWI